MIIVGLTGGIGSGKTSVLQLFIDKGIPVYIADIEAKRLMNSSEIIRNKIIREFGKKSYKDGTLNRPYLAKQVFGNKEKLEKLNAIVHPEVHKDFIQFIENTKSLFIIYENAILFENGSDKWCDYIITVTAPETTRIERVVKRDNVTKQQVKDRISHQWKETEKIAKSDFVIENINWETTVKKVDEIYNKLSLLINNNDNCN